MGAKKKKKKKKSRNNPPTLGNTHSFSFVRFIVNNVVTTRWSMRVSENAIFDASNEKQLAARAELADELQRTCDSARLFCQDAISRAMHTILVSACDDPYVGCCCRTVVVLVGRPPQHNRQQWPAMVRQYCDFLLQYRLQAAH
jgi:hypothetical protein